MKVLYKTRHVFLCVWGCWSCICTPHLSREGFCHRFTMLYAKKRSTGKVVCNSNIYKSNYVLKYTKGMA
jgi:hypothetical protein